MFFLFYFGSELIIGRGCDTPTSSLISKQMLCVAAAQRFRVCCDDVTLIDAHSKYTVLPLEFKLGMRQIALSDDGGENVHTVYRYNIYNGTQN